MITLATLSEASEQRVFDQAARHLLTQKQKSMSGESCAYRGAEGLRCVAGCFITDEEYVKLLEQEPSTNDRNWDTLISNTDMVTSTHAKFMMLLQNIHDSYEPHTWKYALALLAETKQLSTAVLQEFN